MAIQTDHVDMIEQYAAAAQNQQNEDSDGQEESNDQ